MLESVIIVAIITTMIASGLIVACRHYTRVTAIALHQHPPTSAAIAAALKSSLLRDLVGAVVGLGIVTIVVLSLFT